MDKQEKCKCVKPILQLETKQCMKCKLYIDRIRHILLTNLSEARCRYKMKRTYNIGNSCKYGNVVAVSEKLNEVTEDEFYSEIDKSITANRLQRHEKEAKLIKNLKQGVTLGNNYYLIKDVRVANVL